MKINAIILTGLILLLATLSAFAVPTISTLTGTPGDGNTLTITGTGYENHPNDPGDQKPGWYTTFEDQNVAPLSTLSVGTTFTAATGACVSITSVDKADGTYAVRSNMAVECEDFSEAYIRVEDNYGFPLSGHFIFGVHRKNTSPDPTANWKHWRTWQSDGDILPDTYIGNAPSDGSQSYTEACDLDDGTTEDHQDYFDYVKPDSTWQFDLWIGKRESTNFGTDGAFYSRQDGSLHSNTSYAWNCSGQDTGPHNMLEVEDDISNDTTTGFAYYDNVYVDTMVVTYVYFTDANTIAGSTKFWMQPYTAMSTTEITIKQELGDLGSDASAIWAYACQYESCSAGKQLSTAGDIPGGSGDSAVIKTQMRGKLKISGRVKT
jgi:hypothetical protein